MWHFLTLYLLPLFPFLGLLWSPCCCTPGCQFFSDDFAVDDLATNYTSVSGSWSISGGVLTTTSSTAILTGSTANPNADSNTNVSVSTKIGTSGDTARIILNYQNSSNYWYAEVKAGTGAYLHIVQRSGGVDTTQFSQSITQSTGSFFSFCASISGGAQMVANVFGDQENSAVIAGTFTQTGWGLGTGTLAGTVTFDNLTASKVSTSPVCPSCLTTCNTVCSANQASAAYKVVISGDTNCSTNGTYYLNWSTTCTWSASSTGVYFISMQIGNRPDTGTPTGIRVQASVSPNLTNFRHLGALLDCTTMNGVSCANSDGTFGDAAVNCVGGTGTALVYSL